MLSKPLSSNKRVLPVLNDCECFFCRSTYNLDINEIWRGRNRRISIAYGMYVYVCRPCHTIITLNPDNDMDRELREYGKKKFKELHPSIDMEGVFK